MKQYSIYINKHGKNRFVLAAFDNGELISRYSYNDMIALELAKAILEGKGYQHKETIRL